MAKIRTTGIRGEYEYYEYEIHYSAKKEIFYAKNLPDSLEAFECQNFSFSAKDEKTLNILIAQKLKEVEDSLNNWQKFIFYNLHSSDLDCSQIDTNRGVSSLYQQKSLGFDWKVFYINKVGGTEFYVSQEDWDRAKRFDQKIRPMNFNYSGLERLSRIEYTPEVELFFSNITDSLGDLIKKVKARLFTPEIITQIANSGNISLLNSGQND